MSHDIHSRPTLSTDSADVSQALDELRLEVLKTQVLLEELRPARSEPALPDYTLSLAALSQGVTELKMSLAAIQDHPALRLTPMDYQHAMTQSSQAAMQQAIAQFNETRIASERSQHELTRICGAVRSRQQQAFWLAIGCAAALWTGLILSPFLARLLPFGMDTRVAATVMAADRWRAGATLMQAGNPEGWQAIEQASAFWQLNQGAIQACRALTEKSHRDQKCELRIK